MPKKKSKKNNEKIVKVLEEIRDIQTEGLEVSKEHKEISQNQLDESMPLAEQRRWNGWHLLIAILMLTITIVGIIKIVIILDKSTSDVNISVEPTKIIENEKKDIDFTFTIKNVGSDPIDDFYVTKIVLYRVENEEKVQKRVIANNVYGAINCDPLIYGRPNPTLKAGQTCTITKQLTSCPECFDDKDKQLLIYVYFESDPPIEPEILYLEMY